jgi:membrane protein implicated in regulation of membrane protease activity
MIWVVLAALFGLIEALTMGLTTIWFAGGAIAASVAAMAGFSGVVQIVIFFVVSIILIIFTRPLAKKKLNVGNEMTNVDALIGKQALVIKTIEPFTVGQAKVDGLVWSAIAAGDNKTIVKNSTVTIVGIEGVKLIVSPEPRPHSKLD